MEPKENIVSYPCENDIHVHAQQDVCEKPTLSHKAVRPNLISLAGRIYRPYTIFTTRITNLSSAPTHNNFELCHAQRGHDQGSCSEHLLRQPREIQDSIQERNVGLRV